MSVARGSIGESEQERILTLAKQADSSYKAFRQGQLSFSGLHESIMQLEKFIAAREQDASETEIIPEGLSHELLGNLQDAYAFWRTRSDDDFVRRLIKGEKPLCDHSLYHQIAELVRRDLSLISGVRVQRILFIGEGPLPLNAIQIHLQTNLPIDCLARTPDAARIAQDALSSCGFGGGVRLVSAEEVKQHLEEYDLVVVAVVVKPKRSVLKLLRKRCRHGCQVLCRTSDGLRQMLYEPVVPDRDLRGFHRKGLQSGGHTPRISVWLLEAAASAAAQVRLEWLKSVDSSMATQLLRLLNRTLEEETSIGFPGPIDEETGRNLMRQLNQDVAAGHRHVLVAYMDNTIVGQVILSPNSSPNHRHIVELTRGTIDPSFRGGGLALRAFQEVARKCDELRREVICLDVRAGTYAAVWWQYFGFKQYGLLQDYSRVGENRYRGLYLTQTTEELKQRLLELTTGAAVLDAQKQFPIA
jgi:hypothetical protein